MKRSAFNHRKIKRLAKLIRQPLWAARGLAESLWHVTAAHARRGNIGILTDKEIAEEIGWEGKPKALIDALVAAELVDKCSVHRLLVHDWAEHADRSIGLALKREGKDFVRTACAHDAHTARTQSALPEPEPEPEPLPEPEPSPPVASVSAPIRDHTADPDRAAAIRHAVFAVDRWAESSRGTKTEAVRNETQLVEQQCETWAESPPIVHGGQPVSPLAMVPEAVRRIMAGKNPPRFKHVKYALGCIDNALDEMRRFGTTPTGPPDADANRSAENEAIVARVLARRAGAAQ
jgi:hypothetical protein